MTTVATIVPMVSAPNTATTAPNSTHDRLIAGTTIRGMSGSHGPNTKITKSALWREAPSNRVRVHVLAAVVMGVIMHRSIDVDVGM